MLHVKLQSLLSSKYFIKVLIAFVITALVGTMGVGWYYYKKDKTRQEVGGLMYRSMLPEVNPTDRIKMLEEVIAKSLTFRTIAKFRLAEIYLQEKLNEKALGIYREIIHSSAPIFYVELALIHEAILLDKWDSTDNYRVYYGTYNLLKAIDFLNKSKPQEALKILEELKTNIEVNQVAKNLINLILNAYFS